jgi:hypothetical protein
MTMAMTTKRSGVARKLNSTGAKKAVSANAAPGKTRSAKASPAKMASAKAAAHILQAAKGPRTVSHRKIKEAVDKVFRERSRARA